MVARRAIGVVAVAMLAALFVGGWFLLDATSSADGASSADWYGYEVRDDMLTVLYRGDCCEDERSLDVDESATGIVVTVQVERHFQIRS